MRAYADSWMVGTEVELEADPGEGRPSGLLVSVVATMRLRPPYTKYVAREVVFALPLPGYQWVGGTQSPQEAIDTYLRVANAESSLDLEGPEDWQQLVSRDLLEEVRVPVFGSPPKDWQTLGVAIASGAVTSGAVATAGSGHYAVLSGIGITLFMNIAVPASRAFGEGLEYRIGRMLGVPLPEPEQPPQVEAPSKRRWWKAKSGPTAKGGADGGKRPRE